MEAVHFSHKLGTNFAGSHGFTSHVTQFFRFREAFSAYSRWCRSQYWQLLMCAPANFATGLRAWSQVCRQSRKLADVHLKWFDMHTGNWMTASETGGDNFERISPNGQVPIPPMVSCSDFKEQLSPPWEAHRRWDDHETSRLLHNAKIHYHIHESFLLNFILNYKNQAHNITLYFFKTSFNIILPSTFKTLKCSLRFRF